LDGQVWVQDILNIGVDPVFYWKPRCDFSPLVAVCLKTRRSRGQWFTDGVLVEAAQSFKTRLVDAMGHFSAMMQQARRGKNRWRLPGGRKLCPRISKMILAIY